MPFSSLDTSAPAARPAPALAPLLSAVLAAASFVCMDSTIKLMAPRYDAIQLSFFRFAGGSLFAVLLWSWRRTPMPARAAWRLHVIRSAFLLVSIIGYFQALTTLSLALTVTISYLSPIFVAVLAVPVLKEKPSPSIWFALAAGLAGVLMSVAPDIAGGFDGLSAQRLSGIVGATVAAIAFAAVQLLARRQAGRDAIFTIMLVQSLLPMLLLAGPAAWRWKPVATGDLGLIVLVGAFGTLGLLGITYAFTRLEASRVAPIDYTGFVWASLSGFVLFGEVPTPTTAGAAALIIGGCLMLLRR
jgi:drug/metabolite transporter (DMT)-like permease